MTLTDAIKAFFDSTEGQAAAWVLVLPIVDFLLGLAAALRDGTFALDSIAAFLRKHIAGRVFPIWMLLFVGHYAAWSPIAGVNVISGLGLAAALAYIAETVGSIMASWGPKREVQPVPKD